MNIFFSRFNFTNKIKTHFLLISFQMSTFQGIQAQEVTLFAGSGTIGSVDSTGTLASFNHPRSIAVDNIGNLYVADTDNNRIRKITPEGVVTTFAGSDSGSVDSTGTLGKFDGPVGVAVDQSGNVYVADFGNNKIRKITSTGIVTTLAGSGITGSKDATGSLASFYHPTGVAVDNSGNVYVADFDNHKIRKITPKGVVTTLAGSGVAGTKNATGTLASFNHPRSVAVDNSGNVYVADVNNNKIRKITSEGVVTTFAGAQKFGFKDAIGTSSRFNHPMGVSVDTMGNVYVADWVNDKIRKITPTGVVTTLITGACTVPPPDFWCPNSVVVDLSGNFYAVNTCDSKIIKISGIPNEIKR
jgi:streptogramin lyase